MMTSLSHISVGGKTFWTSPSEEISELKTEFAVACGFETIKAIDPDEPDIDEMITVDVDWDGFTDGNFLGIWKEIPRDPLVIFVIHSLDEGVIFPRHALEILRSMERLRVDFLSKRCRLFVTKMAAALFQSIKVGLPVRFSPEISESLLDAS